MNSHDQETRQQQQQQQQQQKQKTQQQDGSRPAMIHSTRSHFETFDQATRDQQLEQQSKDEAMMLSADNPDQALQEASSGVQLDRDVQQSRRIADESKQKASMITLAKH
ncbi:hypothetical protein BG011_008576 [Mortierella polycephala]|uniref:Uncharacterized protein n=1 Tax=Mortierella polycephala TaxID=41804 RepID=A0A9P6PPW6_9FUNG|nr:hypothetical protein BG011_008576 [Mortierella polycephala]